MSRRRAAPVVLRVANFQSVSARPEKSRAIFAEALTKPGRFGVPHVVLGCEGADFKAEGLAELHGFDAAQFTTNSATAGSVVAWDERHGAALTEPELVPGSAAGEGIQARSLVRVKLRVNGHASWFAAGHAPPDRAQHGQDSWYARIKRYRGILGGDFNNRPGEVQPRFRRTYLGVELIGALVPRRIATSLPRAVDIGSDHPAVDIRLWASPAGVGAHA